MAEASIGLVLDCAEPEILADFWSSALGMVKLGAAGNYVMLVSESGTLPKLLLQRVGESKAGKNRMHLDIEVRDVDAEVSRLEGIGACRADNVPRTEHGTTWVIMADPESNEFCVCDGGQGAAS